MSGFLLASLVGIELCLRLLGIDARRDHPFPQFQWVVSDPVLGWINAPGFDGTTIRVLGREFEAGFRINSHGFRGPEIATGPPGLRIACLGDSGTFGISRTRGLMSDKSSLEASFASYPEVLSKRLKARTTLPVEVINGGVIGYTSAHGLRQLITEIVDLDPAIVTFRFGVNDHAYAKSRALTVREPQSALARWLFYTFDDWRLFRLGADAWRKREPAATISTQTPWLTPQEFAANLRRTVEVCRAHGIHLLFIDYPLRPLELGTDLGPELKLSLRGRAKSLEDFHEKHRRYQSILETVARETGTPLLHSAYAFSHAAVPSFSGVDVVHPSPAAVDLLADLIVEKLVALGWVPVESGR